ncbi:hypothetical protein QR680_002712 [Steinernema hermaphroditum]|uniref:Uncharacterized protein n=1 Tax=Steinernema hermaphroditum TaxID=289476 RepID=A0AA39H4P0_9BILA|nr:hypothetical protein QR680_002712 [Steinernema hermaphroditum]
MSTRRGNVTPQRTIREDRGYEELRTKYSPPPSNTRTYIDGDIEVITISSGSEDERDAAPQRGCPHKKKDSDDLEMLDLDDLVEVDCADDDEENAGVVVLGQSVKKEELVDGMDSDDEVMAVGDEDFSQLLQEACCAMGDFEEELLSNAGAREEGLPRQRRTSQEKQHIAVTRSRKRKESLRDSRKVKEPKITNGVHPEAGRGIATPTKLLASTAIVKQEVSETDSSTQSGSFRTSNQLVMIKQEVLPKEEDDRMDCELKQNGTVTSNVAVASSTATMQLASIRVEQNGTPGDKDGYSSNESLCGLNRTIPSPNPQSTKATRQQEANKHDDAEKQYGNLYFTSDPSNEETSKTVPVKREPVRAFEKLNTVAVRESIHDVESSSESINDEENGAISAVATVEVNAHIALVRKKDNCTDSGTALVVPYSNNLRMSPERSPMSVIQASLQNAENSQSTNHYTAIRKAETPKDDPAENESVVKKSRREPEPSSAPMKKKAKMVTPSTSHATARISLKMNNEDMHKNIGTCLQRFIKNESSKLDAEKVLLMRQMADKQVSFVADILKEMGCR